MKLYIMSNVSFAPFCFKWKPIHVFWLLLVMVTAVLFLLITFTPGTVIARRRVIKSVREVVTESSAEPSEEPGRFISRKVMFSPVSVCSQGGPHVTITNDAMNLTVQGPLGIRNGSPPVPLPDIRPGYQPQPEPPLVVITLHPFKHVDLRTPQE